MAYLRVWLVCTLVLWLTPLSRPQGNAANFGQQAAPGMSQGGGGGLGGGGFGREMGERADRKSRPEDDQVGWETRTAILTPGDRVEFKFTMKKGETVMAAVTSDAFDPALSFEDSGGKVLQKNDDRVEGDQSPFLIYRVPADGTYTLKVLSFRSVAGGKFSLRSRTFSSIDAGFGKKRHETERQTGDRARRVVFRIEAKKDKVYDLRFAYGILPRSGFSLGMVKIIGPTGVDGSDLATVWMPDGSDVFVALKDGDYYAEYGSRNDLNTFETDYHEVTVRKVGLDSDQTIDTNRQDLAVMEFEVEPNKIVRTVLTGSLIYSLSAPADENLRRDLVNELPSTGNNPSFAWFKANVDSDRDVVRIFHGKGTARLAIRSIGSAAQKVGVKNSTDIPVWQSGVPMKGELKIGESKLVVVRSAQSELMRVFVGTDYFQPLLQIYRLSGELANSLSTRASRTAGDDLYFPDADTFLFRMSCSGDGGSGQFTMKRDVLQPEPYKLGTTQTIKLDETSFGLYAVDLEAGKRYELMTSDPQLGIRADLLDDDGQFLVSQSIRFDKVEVQYFVPTRSGRHRLWLRGRPGTRQFRFQQHTPPGFGAGSGGGGSE